MPTCFATLCMQHCMKKAVDNNMLLVTHIHLDDGLDKGTWRNSIIFNPGQKYGALTYWEAVAKPTAMALKDANYKKRDVYYAMQVRQSHPSFYKTSLCIPVQHNHTLTNNACRALCPTPGNTAALLTDIVYPWSTAHLHVGIFCCSTLRLRWVPRCSTTPSPGAT